MKSHLYVCILVLIVIFAQAQVQDTTPNVIDDGAWMSQSSCTVPQGWQVLGSSTTAQSLCSKCGEKQILGGFQVLGANSIITRSYTNLAAHYKAKVSFNFWKIDAWNKETFNLLVNGVSIASYTFTMNQDQQICGNTNNDKIQQVTVEFNHTSPQLLFSFETDINQASSVESWGISDYSFQTYPCDPLCLACTGPSTNQCSACSTDGFLYIQAGQNSCVKQCPAGLALYGDFNTHTCLPCNIACLVCNGPNDSNCLNCLLGQFIFNNRCFDKCPTGTYTDALSMTCSQTCKTGTFPNQLTFTCQTCDLTVCKTCSTSATTCATCNNNQFSYVDGKCYTQTTCPLGAYPDVANKNCAYCDPNCIQCTGPGSDQCQKCAYNRYTVPSRPNTCGLPSQCPQGTFPNSANFVCTQCADGCATCNGILANQCLSCIAPNLFSVTNCVKVCTGLLFESLDLTSCVASNMCGSGYYGAVTDKGNKCAPCFSGCSGCTGPLFNQCTACAAQKYFSPTTNTCVDAGGCPVGQYSNMFSAPLPWSCTAACGDRLVYASANGQCLRCDISCVSCVGPSNTDCTLCFSPKTFLNPRSNKCVTQCSEYDIGSYGNTATTKCEMCWQDPSGPCKTCSGGSPQQCLSCNAGFTLDNGVCRNNNIIGGTVGGQLICSNGGLLLNGVCVSICPAGFFKSQDLISKVLSCQSCDQTCRTCSDVGANKCTSCWGGYASPARFLYKVNQDTDITGTCVTQCPNNMAERYGAGICDVRGCRTQFNYPQFQGSDQICQNCDLNCALCHADPSNGMKSLCETCVAPFVLIGNSCAQTSCLTASFPSVGINGVCVACDLNCLTCTGTTTKCATCKAGYALDIISYKCTSLCQMGQFLDVLSKRCIPCNAYCTDCFGGLNTQCITCATSTKANPIYTLQLVQGGSLGCFRSCPIKYYGDVTSNTCKACYLNCSICSGPAQTDCFSCGAGLFIDGTNCVQTCPANKVVQNVPSLNNAGEPTTIAVCVDCSKTGCNTCAQVDGITVCLSCPLGQFLVGGLCVINCPLGFYKNAKLASCSPCNSICSSCSDANTCQSCNKGYFMDMISATCTRTCPQNYYGNIQNNKCVEFCPDGYFNNNVSNLCQACDPSCGTCYDATNQHCTSCSANMFSAFFTTNSNPNNAVISPLYFPDQFINAQEYAVSGWAKWSSTAPTPDYSTLFRLTDVQMKQAKDLVNPGDRTLAVWYGGNGNYLFATYSCPTQDNNCDTNKYVQSPYGKSATQWIFIYYGYSRTLSQAYTYLQLSGVPQSQTQTQIFHFLPTTFYFTLGRDPYYPGFSGDMAGMTLNFGPGSYQEGGYDKSVGSINFGYSIGLQEQNQLVLPPGTKNLRMLATNDVPLLNSAYNAATPLVTTTYGLESLNATNNNQYGFGLWTRYLTTYPIRQIMGNNNNINVIGSMTQNNPYTQGSTAGDRLLFLSMGKTGYTFATYSDIQLTVAQTIPFPYPTTGLVEGVWIYLYICYSVPDQTMFGFMKSPASVEQVSLTKMIHKPLSYLKFTLGGIFDKNDAFNGQFASPIYGFGKQYYISTKDQLNTLLNGYPRPLNYVSALTTINTVVAPQTQTGTKPLVQQVITSQDFFSEYSVSGWIKFTPPVNQNYWNTIFRLSNINATQLQDFTHLGDRDLAMWISKDPQSFYLASYDYKDLAGNGNDDIDRWIPYSDQLNNQWNFVYFGYSRTLRKAFGAISFQTATGTTVFNEMDHYLTNSVYLQVGNDIYGGQQKTIYDPFSGQIACFNFNYGPGAYSEGPFALADNRFSFSSCANVNNTFSDIEHQLGAIDTAYTEPSAVLTKIWLKQDMPIDKSQYGYGYWFRFTTLYPVIEPNGMRNPWYILSRMSFNNPGQNDAQMGDRPLGVWQGNDIPNKKQFFTFRTQDLTTNNYDVTHDIPFVGYTQEGQWNFLTFSYSLVEKQAVAIIQYGSANPIVLNIPKITHAPLADYLRFTLGRDSFVGNYDPAFNGQFVNPVYGIGKGAYISNIQDFNQLQIDKSRPPIDYWATHPLQNKNLVNNAITINAGYPDQQRYLKYQIMANLPEEYSFSGWYKWTPDSEQQQWTNAFRVGVHRDDNPTDMERLGDRDLVLFLSKSAPFYQFNTYTYFDMFGNGQNQVYLESPVGNQLNLWHYVYFGYSRKISKAFGYVKYRDYQQTIDFPGKVDHYLTPQFTVWVGGDYTDRSYNGQIAYNNFNLGPGSFRTSFSGLTSQNDIYGYYQGLTAFKTSTDPNPNPANSTNQKANAALYSSSQYGPSSVNHTFQSNSLQDTTEFGYGFWARWLFTYPNRIWTTPTSSLMSVFQVNPSSTNDISQMGQDSLSIYMQAKSNKYVFQTQDVASQSTINENVDFIGNQEGSWNYFYFSYSYSNKLAVGFIIQSGYQTQMIEISATNPPIKNSAYFSVGGQFALQTGFNGQIGNVAYGVGSGNFINSIGQLNTYVAQNFLQLGDMTTPLFFDVLTTPPKQLTTPQSDGKGAPGIPYNNVGFPKEYAVSGWFKWTRTTNTQDLHSMFLLTINKPSDLQDNVRLGDRTLGMWYGEQSDSYQYATYSYDINHPDSGQISQYGNFVAGADLTTWAFIYFGYTRNTWVSRGYVKWADHDAQFTHTNTYNYLSNDFWLYMPDNYNSAFNGQIADFRLQFGPGSFVADNNFGTSDDRYRQTIGLSLTSYTDLQIYQPQNASSVQSLTFDQSTSVYSNVLQDNGGTVKINGVSEYGYGMWTRWSRTGPTKSVTTKAPWYLMGAIDTTSYTGAPAVGQNALSSYIGQGFYQFRAYNGGAAVTMNINYGNQLDGVWNFVYFSYSKFAGTATAWVEFNDGSYQTVSVPAVENTVQNYLSFRVKQDPNYDQQNLLFNGYMTQIIFAIGSGSYVSTQQQLNSIITKYVPLPLAANLTQVQRRSLNLLASASTHSCGIACPPGYSENTANGQRLCSPCSATCKSCYYTDANKCSDCYFGTYLYQGACLTACPTGLVASNLLNICISSCQAGTFLNPASPTGGAFCQTCFPSCATCTGNTNSLCTSCNTGFALINTTCSSTCPAGYYVNAQVCATCPNLCATCSSSTVCLSCLAGGFFYGNKCNIDCSFGVTGVRGYYSDKTLNVCGRCTAPCLDCSGAGNSQCLSCTLNLKLVSGVCQSTCGAGTYSSSNVCLQCPLFAATCNSLVDVTLCIKGYFIFQGQCVNSCSAGYYVDTAAQTCSRCHPYCKTCTDATFNSCPTCAANAIQVAVNVCSTTCLDGFFLTKVLDVNTCTACQANCYRCNDATTCSQCVDTYYLQGTRCVLVCDPGYYPVDALQYEVAQINTTPDMFIVYFPFCKKCDTACATCFGEYNYQCPVCAPNYTKNPKVINGVVGFECLDKCPVGKYASLGSCLTCSSLCTLCSSSSVCQGCAVGFLSLGACVPTCPDGTFANKQLNTCQQCSIGCATCIGSNTNQCNTCSSGYFQYGTQCLNQCPTGTYKIQGTCQNCLYGCLTCADGQSCATCPPKKFLFDGLCEDTCPTGYYGNDQRVCTSCNPACISCTGGSIDQCTGCNDGFLLSGTTCKQGCADGKYLDSTFKCQACPSSCATCVTATQCTACQTNFFLQDASCVGKCASNTYLDKPKNTCFKCFTTCASCTGPLQNNCLTCIATLYYFQSTCVSACADGYFADNQNQICSACNPQCATCQNVNTCLKCNSGKFLMKASGSCLLSCPLGYYGAVATNECGLCDSSCTQCTGPTNANCQACAEANILTGSVCSPGCPQGKFLAGAKCQLCQPQCKECSIGTECISCTAGYYLSAKQCIVQCPPGTFGNKPDWTCKNCDSSCLTCSDALKTSCLTCPVKLLFDVGTCVAQCPAGKYSDKTKCLNCPGSCATCLDSVTCQTCVKGLVLQQTVCQQSCKTGYYPDAGSICQICNPACASCAGREITQCTACNDGYLLHTTTCDPGCIDRYFLQNAKCVICPPSCALCSSLTQCSKCSSGYFLQNNQCVTTCPSGRFANAPALTCDLCDSTCQTCSSQLANACLTCPTSYYFYNGYCLLTCPVGAYKLSSTQCAACNADCSACTSLAVCTSCVKGRVLENGVCKNSCDPTYYVNTATQTCNTCLVGCAICDNGDTCITTLPGYINDSKKRPVPGCVDGYFLSSGTCLACPSSCATCTSTTQCLTCALNNYLNLFSCGTTCPASTYPSNGICAKCVNGCATCTGVNNCQTCSSGFYQYNNLCVTDCPVGYFVKDGKCTPCDSSCYSCSDLNTCTGCTNKLTLQGTQCLTKCNDGYFELLEVCLQCYQACATCVGRDLNQCTSCMDGFVIKNSNTCVQGCITGKYLSNGKCLTCATNCLSCNNAAECLVPALPYFINNGTVVPACPVGKYGSTTDRFCKACDITCATCIGGNLAQCLTCANSLILNINTCVTQCPDGRFNLKGICADCNSNCATCQDAVVCSTCGSGLALQSGACQKGCNTQYFQNTNAVCQQCNPACSSCTGTAINQCLSCNEGYQISGSTCLPGCANGYYLSNGKCPPCDPTCATCESATVCLSCSGLLFLKSGKCLPDCGDNMFKNTLSHECNRCYLTCSTCTSSAKNACNTCETGFVLQSSQCLSTCSDGYYAASQICLACDSTCLTCNAVGPKACTQCATPSYLSLGSCVQKCPASQFGNQKTNVCQNCSPACANCTAADSSSCSVCNEGFLLALTTCNAGCVQGKYLDSGKCLPCQTGCSVCTGALQCTQCVLGEYLNKQVCTVTCPSGYYGASNGICESCPIGCLTCTDGNTCQTCSPKYLYDDASCVQSCELGRYINVDRCSLCVAGCAQCVNGIDCQACQSGLALQGTVCQPKCNAAFYTSQSRVCVACNTACAGCVGPLISQCNACNDGYLLISTTCQPGCIAGKFLQSQRCLTCANQCTLCDSLTVCGACAKGFFLQGTTCAPSCPDGYFGDVGSLRCVQCSPQCLKCTALGVDSCQLCASTFLLSLPSSCVQQCPTATYVDTKRTCQNCSPTCGQCSDFATCTTCNKPLALYNATCIATCPGVMFINANNVCKYCNSACTSCTGPSTTECGGCVDGYLLAPQSTTCNAGCVNGKYLQSGKCLTCSANCAICSGSATCTTCASNFFLEAGACVLVCPDGSYGANRVCEDCNLECTKCSGPTVDKCSACVSGYLLSATTCVNKCPNGQYQSNNACNNCDTNCLTCTNTLQCTKCSGTLVSMNGVCAPQCLDGYYNNLGMCSSCDNACFRCTNSGKDSCQTCNEGYLLTGSSCNPGCVDGYFLSNNKCLPCSPGCVQCGSADKCDYCGTTLFLSNNICIAKCPLGTYAAAFNVCRRCIDACSTCQTGDNLNCQSCSFGYYQYKTQCLQQCPLGTFSQITTPPTPKTAPTNSTTNSTLPGVSQPKFICTACPSTCLSCTQNSQCTQCLQGIYLQNGACLLQCSMGYYTDSNFNCLPCNSGCSACSGYVQPNANITNQA